MPPFTTGPARQQLFAQGRKMRYRNSTVHHRHRKLLFYAFAGVFIIVSAYLIMTLRGWVIDPKGFRIVETGSLFIDYKPTDAALLIDGALSDAASGFMKNGVLVGNLLPKQYVLRIEKPGYEPWEKTLTVRSGEVTAASHVNLWPIEAPETTLLTGNSAFWLTDAGLVVKDSRGTLRAGGRALKGHEVVLSDQNSAYLVTRDGPTFYFTDLDNPESALNLSELFKSLLGRSERPSTTTAALAAADWHPFSRGVLILHTSVGIFSLDTRRIELQTIAPGSAPEAATLIGNTLLSVDKAHTLMSANLLTRTAATATLTISGTVARLDATEDLNTILALTGDGTLYRSDRADGTVELISRNVSDFVLSPEERRLAVAHADGTLELVYLDAYVGDTREAPGTHVPLGLEPRVTKIEKLEWMRGFSTYLIVLGDGRVTAVETDSREPQQSSVLAEDVTGYALESELFVLKKNGNLVSLDIVK